jgi:hypothetical protein
MKTPIEILIESLEKNTVLVEGPISINVDGIKYRYDTYLLKYANTAYWLRLQFEKASLFITGKEYNKSFFYEDYSFNFDRAISKNEKDRKISMKKLVILS